jgi:hypothetical protein
MIQTASNQAFFLILISVSLGVCLVFALWEIEGARERHRHLAREARRPVKPGR